MPPLAELSDAQRELRNQGVGASEVPAILGLDPYRTALDVFLDKTGQAEPFPETQYTRWGKRLEAVIADEYQDRHPDLVLGLSSTIVGPEPWMLATPDRVVANPIKGAVPKGTWGLECKSRGLYNRDAWGEHGTDEVPHAVAAQCHWSMVVTGLKRWDVAVLLGGNDYREYTLQFDEKIARGLVATVRAFWMDNVQAKVHPPFTGADSDHRFLYRTYPTHTSEIVAAPPEVNQWARELQSAKTNIKELGERQSQLEARLKEYIADRMGVEGPFGQITWKHMNEVEVKAHTKKAHRRLLTKFSDD